MTVLYTLTTLLVAFYSLTGIVGPVLANVTPKWTAKCVMEPSAGKVTVNGTVQLEQLQGSKEVTLQVDLAGVPAASSVEKHGFHVHAKGDLTNNCVDAGGHFNPHNKVHGGPTDAIRHVGDLGNVNVKTDGTFKDTIKDSIISLDETKTNSIIGKAIVIHEGEDDLGKTNATDSKTTGNAGARIGCCKVVLLTKPPASGVDVISACAGVIIAVVFFTFNV